MNILIVVLLTIWIALSIGATIYLLRTRSSREARRRTLLLITWLVPVIGALLALFLTTRPQAPSPPTASDETMAIDVLAAGAIDSGGPSDPDAR
jgi:hypothetical protein